MKTLKHIPSIVSLSIPIWIGQLASIANPVLDTAMVSHYSVIDLGALSVGSAIYISVYVALNGVMQSLSPTFGQLFGARNFKEIGAQARQGLWLAVICSIIGALILFFPEPFLAIANTSPEFLEKSTKYLKILAFTLPAPLFFLVYATLNNSIARPKMVMAIQILGVILKIPLNTLFIFGGFGIEPMGGPGCALATFIIMWVEVIICFLIVRFSPSYNIFVLFKNVSFAPHFQSIRNLLKIGIPLGCNAFIEITSFTFMALFISRLGIDKVAGHQIIANFAGVLYMAPLAFASATSTLAAHAIGSRNFNSAQEITRAGAFSAVAFALCISSFVWFAQDFILSLYTKNPDVFACAKPLFIFLCIMHLFDGIQVTASFVLRAYKVVLTPTIFYVISLWIIGLGGGYVASFNLFPEHIPARITGSSGFWCCNTISIISLAILLPTLLFFIERQAKQDPERFLIQPSAK